MVRNLQELGPNMQKIISRLQANSDLLKLLYYTDTDPLGKSNLTQEQIKEEVYEKLIKIIPRVGPKENAKSIICLRVVRGSTDLENSEFKNFLFEIEVFVPLTQWLIKDKNLRPFSILGEIQKSLNGKKIDGLGKLVGGDFELNFLTEEMSCYLAQYKITSYD